MPTISLTSPLSTAQGRRLYRLWLPAWVALLRQLEGGRSVLTAETLDQLRERIKRLCDRRCRQSNAFFDDLFVLREALEFLEAYAQTWHLIANGKFGQSWTRLQDALDHLRLIQKFSGIDASLFERRLTELERAYPYKVFFSIGMIVKRFECSICGHDIDSPECAHRRGHLYRGQLARAVVRNATEINHIAMVSNPADKRCVVHFEDESDEFSIVRFLSQALVGGNMTIGQFDSLRFSRKVPRQIRRTFPGRNELCHCGSKKKYKRCCAEKDDRGDNHVEIVLSAPRPTLVVNESPISPLASNIGRARD